MSDDIEDTLNVPPFPPLTWDDYFWTSRVVLKPWAGFQSRLGPYGSVSAAAGSDGSAQLMVNPPDEQRVPPTQEQTAAFQYLLDHEEEIRDAVLQAIFVAYPGFQETYGYEGEDAEELLPDITQADDLKALIGLSNIHILTTVRDGVAYVGFEFGCTWDSEHGLGVMTHKARVIEVGGADTSFLDWIAEEDAGAST